MTTVLLADDHPIIVTGVAALLGPSEFRIVAHVSNGEAALAAVDQLDPEILLLDYSMPGKSGLEVLRILRQKGDRRPVVFLTASVDEGVVLEAYQLGLNGLVMKHAAPDLLLICLDEVRRGGRWIDQMLLQRALTAALGSKSADGLSALSPREREIVDLVSAGDRPPKIAEKLGISAGTVKVHLHRIYEKLGVGSRAELILYVRDHG
jgi:two-component system nitrate/nitrite response regulator NarP